MSNRAGISSNVSDLARSIIINSKEKKTHMYHGVEMVAVDLLVVFTSEVASKHKIEVKL